MRTNYYIEDAKYFLKKAASFISEKMENDTVIDCVLFISLGFERLFKGILYNINPIYVLKKEEFKNTAPILYESLIIDSSNPGKEISRTPIQDVLSFRHALLRARLFSPTTNNFSNNLFFISTCRDTIVHRPLNELPIDRMKKLLSAEFLIIVKEYARELDLSLVKFIGDKVRGLEFLAKDYPGELEEKLKKKIAFFQNEWKRISSDEKEKHRIARLKEHYNNPHEYDKGECPACKNVGVFKAEIDYGYSEGITRPIGVYPIEFKCSFCGFYADDPEELDHLKLVKNFYENQEI